ncbi:hypothetical protein CONPUDRAFT_157462 [Coniophora puteana RWD-64-598 SS2]|uniref:RING-type domain-containing protein n=1 Tax=Coniophora puteana (strain RWD-64-598) TaxID=741705 RepID=A0A5M3MD76_CONPW|nr:uncharacterized protein CONPUDRAFT_157462 [Coniophora puteana RWD-64-598 SS2]EIW77199.1 hypothetical protein CONPUDRAFT_157462 [Coniophora puteana RWD-64-598 SS2]
MPASAPTTPAVTRPNKIDRFSASPVTPQRISRAQKLAFHSPATPATNFSSPYTPISLRSFATPTSSTLTTPESTASARYIATLDCPENGLDLRAAFPEQGFTDLAESWRNRATEHGIKVSNADDSTFADDEASDFTPSDTNSTGFVADDVLIPPPFLSSHRRTRTQSYAAPQNFPLAAYSAHTPARRTLTALNTPPRNPTNASQLKLKGSLTDPAHTRRRPSFSQVRCSATCVAVKFNRESPLFFAFKMTNELFDIDEDAYDPYPQSFSSPTQPFVLQDPFNSHTLSTISETVHQAMDDSPMVRHNAVSMSGATCSDCGACPERLAMLSPCGHPLCPSCLTSAINIVGEKDMQCAVCKNRVVDFNLQANKGSGPRRTSPSSPLQSRQVNHQHTPLLPSVFESNLGPVTTPFQCCTPAPIRRGSERVVLRIDNVPWDITPSMIRSCPWLHGFDARAYVLIDRQGKTLSHAFVELSSSEEAKATLRDAQNAVLGRGKRARGVTVTRSSQEDLMRALFPSWKGNFDGSKPTLIGLQGSQLNIAFQSGLLSDAELTSLKVLIESRDAHFVKDPSLPFHALINILNKFPIDIDSRVFWTPNVRDLLFGVTITALEVLVARLNEPCFQREPTILEELLHAAIACRVFAHEQTEALANVDRVRSAIPSPPSFSASHSRATSSESYGAPDPTPQVNAEPYCAAIARELQVPEAVVQSVARKLIGMQL